MSGCIVLFILLQMDASIDDSEDEKAGRHPMKPEVLSSQKLHFHLLLCQVEIEILTIFNVICS
jgi:hypothetical protein